MAAMAAPLESPTPSERPSGEVFLDARGNGRALRLSWHHESDLVVLSLWRHDVCVGTFRLTRPDVGAFVDALVDGLREGTPPTTAAHSAGRRRRTTTPAVETGQVLYGDLAAPGRHRAEPPAPAFTEWAFGDEPGHATAS